MAEDDERKRPAAELEAEAIQQRSEMDEEQDWPELAAQLRDVRVPADLNDKLKRIADRTTAVELASQGSFLRRPAHRVGLMVTAAAVLLIAVAGLLIYVLPDRDNVFQARPENENAPFNERNRRPGDSPSAGSKGELDRADPESNHETGPNSASPSELEKQWADLEMQLAIAQQVADGLQNRKNTAPAVVPRYEIARSVHYQSNREAIAAELVMSANYEVEVGGGDAASHPNYAQVVRLFPDTKWASVARQHVEMPD